ncbi:MULTISPECIES: endonuclease I family protein [unclassified Pseudomonas]|uniref:endonuclease I family protein n=1 Tax=unclassified Pseudomonas TaxID=196821 RepID=UPI002446FCF4|nr:MULTISPECIES: endonuclease I family protein [unclassified Pseudomonas]MDG9930022.1 endonuclease I family protein [Pseudomonas sp. GD04042]MDH0483252.1 endonuclease I family protein [Pseudomonas sp. GD04015]MDH0606839.1 endonuclease I family protein [Pseudomonas sp. GD03869]
MPWRCALLLLCCISLPSHAAPPRTFAEAKKIAWQLYAPQSVEFYCGCRYSGNRIDLRSCGYTPRKNPQRAARIEWEHLVPAWVIGHQRRCWKQGGRQHCAHSDDTFRRAEADLFNLVPSIGEINGDRSNFPFAWLPQKPHQYGTCPMVVDFKAGKAMPRPEVRGMIARTYLYMSQRYGLRLSRQERQLFDVWNRHYPAKPWERQRNQRIACVMGWSNPFVEEADLRACPGPFNGKGRKD